MWCGFPFWTRITSSFCEIVSDSGKMSWTMSMNCESQEK